MSMLWAFALIMVRPTHMKQIGPGMWQQTVFTVRCPYCTEGNEFRLMVGLNGSADGTFFCSKCRHLARSGDPAFKCLCANCRKLNGGESRA